MFKTIGREEKTIFPKKIVKTFGTVSKAEQLCKKTFEVVFFGDKEYVSMKNDGEENARIIIDFGKEICGSIRIVSLWSKKSNKIRIVFGESLGETLGKIGEKGFSNDHSPHDMEVEVPCMSDLYFGQTGFRFVAIELISENSELRIGSISARCVYDKVHCKGYVITDDKLLNKILRTSDYTCRLNLQKGVIWDGIKRDRLVWSGDLNAEILTASYVFGANTNVKNSLSVLAEMSEKDGYVNSIPSYSAWWIINLCDYYKLSGDGEFFTHYFDKALETLKKFDCTIDENGYIDFTCGGEKFIDMPFYLDWPTYGTEDAKIGTAMLIYCAALRFSKYVSGKEKSVCSSLIRKLEKYRDEKSIFKQTLAIQVILGGAKKENALPFLTKDGSEGFSTFMAYYILKAISFLGSNGVCKLIKEYYGAMLSLGATSFWEDFDIKWIKENNCSRIDEFPKETKKDIHGDFGKFCYKGYRHSLCHGWSCGVSAFVVEEILGLKILEPGFKKITVKPNLTEIKRIKAKIATPFGAMKIICKRGEEPIINAPNEIEIV